ncbi:MAG: RNA polymerase sigma-70 factor [Marinilabiliales bacterium]|nr:MAG: RNA polymerase sigma-70 factor [Marinilabiliales bacterium]
MTEIRSIDSKGLTKASFEEMFRKEFKNLVIFSLKYVKDMETARGIVQDCFIYIWEKRENMDEDKNLKSYITTMVYNRSLNYLRDNKKFDRNILEFEGLMDEKSEMADSGIMTRELKGEIHEAIGSLPEKCREVFLLSRQENMKYQEIADHLGISVKTVENQMGKALKMLRERLGPYLPLLLLSIFQYKDLIFLLN